MDWAFVDTSAMVKRYLDEPGHREVVRLLRQSQVAFSGLLPVEFRGTIRRRVQDRTLTPGEAHRVLRKFAVDRTSFTTVELTPDVLSQGELLVATHPIRTLDALQVASARLFASRLGAPVVFLSADKRQADIAAAVGLTVAVIGQTHG
jgi:uncharacterized protein